MRENELHAKINRERGWRERDRIANAYESASVCVCVYLYIWLDNGQKCKNDNVSSLLSVQSQRNEKKKNEE